jgi:hypothetical protein
MECGGQGLYEPLGLRIARLPSGDCGAVGARAETGCAYSIRRLVSVITGRGRQVDIIKRLWLDGLAPWWGWRIDYWSTPAAAACQWSEAQG